MFIVYSLVYVINSLSLLLSFSYHTPLFIHSGFSGCLFCSIITFPLTSLLYIPVFFDTNFFCKFTSIPLAMRDCEILQHVVIPLSFGVFLSFSGFLQQTFIPLIPYFAICSPPLRGVFTLPFPLGYYYLLCSLSPLHAL